MRQTLRTAALVAIAGGLLAVAGCSDDTASTAAVTPANAQEATPAAPATTAATPAKPAVEAPKPNGTVDVAKLMEPGPLPDVVVGDVNAPVTIVEYASMTCPHCAAFALQTLPEIKKTYIDTGKAKLILREFPFDPRAVAAFMLARCAPGDRREAMVDVLFQQQESWAHSDNASAALLGIAKLAGFTQESFTACLNDKDLQAKVVATQARGQSEFGVEATPTLIINGNRYSGALTAPQLSAVIDSLL
ncbi:MULTISPECIES: DsbA family protein [unclassified Aureimonas]|uniref:DsbA family protein n=1 Tax=unclassified Aureimonas TaxID=2615206 RepID=UPI0006F6641B|nr:MULTISPECIES: DsbA family protein [unclassified Aureimonas]KQT61285.1 disulfide bond formation protein DsbA [Aureimonas sp. Leaf460]KQT68734.1 disulfide bond formation protein DsbA [Aureimonas sp. Leaf427]